MGSPHGRVTSSSATRANQGSPVTDMEAQASGVQWGGGLGVQTEAVGLLQCGSPQGLHGASKDLGPHGSRGHSRPHRPHLPGDLCASRQVRLFPRREPCPLPSLGLSVPISLSWGRTGVPETGRDSGAHGTLWARTATVAGTCLSFGGQDLNYRPQPRKCQQRRPHPRPRSLGLERPERRRPQLT